MRVAPGCCTAVAVALIAVKAGVNVAAARVIVAVAVNGIIAGCDEMGWLLQAASKHSALNNAIKRARSIFPLSNGAARWR
jgi:ABC-type enterobactin transport system permease subunit